MSEGSGLDLAFIVVYLLLVHVAGTDGAKSDLGLALSQRENQKNVPLSVRFTDGSHARLVWVGV